jgi:predicted ATPase
MEKLNVLIGPNGSGKSNLIEAVALMRATHGDFQDVLRQGGGSAEWIWKGERANQATLDFVVSSLKYKSPLRHLVAFQSEGHIPFRLEDERIESASSDCGEAEPFFCYRNRMPVVSNGRQKTRRKLPPETFNRDLSVLAQLRDPRTYPEISFLANAYEMIRIYREWTFGRATVFRQPQMADMPNDRLEEDFSNLGLFVNRLRREPQAKAAVLAGLRDLYEGLSDYDVIVEGGTVQVFFTEGKFTIPANRLSDGTLRFLCLLAILYDPKPPPLICIEEPELGLHPDILPKLADHLAAASERTQIIVTTHSDILVDAMTERPEAVVVCEKREGRTQMQRLSHDDLAVWLEKYRLGQLWTKGQLGGTRW